MMKEIGKMGSLGKATKVITEVCGEKNKNKNVWEWKATRNHTIKHLPKRNL